MIFFATVLTICVVLFVWWVSYRSVHDQAEDLGRRLTTAGWFVVVSPTCGACHNQQTILGDMWSSVKSVQCAKNPQLCAELKVRAVPLWANEKTKEQKIGVQTMEQLESMCRV